MPASGIARSSPPCPKSEQELDDSRVVHFTSPLALHKPDEPAGDEVTLAMPAASLPSASNDGPDVTLLHGWRKQRDHPSLEEVHSSIPVPGESGTWYGNLFAFMGVGILISVGYMDPGNWATGLSAGSSYGYTLLIVILLSNFCAMFLQGLALKLGIVAERDLAQCCRDGYSKWTNYTLWLLMEVAIAATDLAEIIGSATALYLLFGLPLWAGVLVTLVDVLFLVVFGMQSFRLMELVIFLLCATIAGCFIYEIAAVDPDWADVARGFVPRPRIITDSGLLYNAIGILGATVMPHNLFLHSSIIQTRAYERTPGGKRHALKYGRADSTAALACAFFVNAAIVILAGAAFYYNSDQVEIAYISDAYHLLTTAVGTHASKILFGVALLCCGQNSTITGTLAGQIVMEGFIQVKLRPWVRRAITRGIAVVPAAVVAGIFGNTGAGKLLILSQVILSLTLIFAVVPLMHFTSSRAKMGQFVNCWTTVIVGWLLAFIIGALNAYLVIQSIRQNNFGGAGSV